jgi:hypothetical protein
MKVDVEDILADVDAGGDERTLIHLSASLTCHPGRNALVSVQASMERRGRSYSNSTHRWSGFHRSDLT